MLIPHIVVFHDAKEGNSPTEWEDGAGHDSGDPAARRPARCIVVDGATEAYDSIRWARQLIRSFVGDHRPGDRPAVTRPALESWFAAMQDRWRQDAPRSFSSYFEQRKFEDEGSFATFLACQIDGAPGVPTWSAAALGDAVLFHVRGHTLIDRFPRIEPADFGLDPNGISTQPTARAHMSKGLLLRSGPLEAGDRLYLATDAMAHWMLEASRNDPLGLWTVLAGIEHPDLFRRIVRDARSSHAMHNDDVTLIRIVLDDSNPRWLVVCQ